MRFQFQTKLTTIVYGLFSHGANKGRVNPAEQVKVTTYGACFIHALRKLREEIGDTFFKIDRVEDGDYDFFFRSGEEAKAITSDLQKQAEADTRYAAKVKARQSARDAAQKAAMEEYDLAALDVLEYDARLGGVDA